MEIEPLKSIVFWLSPMMHETIEANKRRGNFNKGSKILLNLFFGL